MKKRVKKHCLFVAFLLFILPFFLVFCSIKSTCHQSIKVINNSQSKVYIGRPAFHQQADGVEYVWLTDCCETPVLPNDTAIIQIIDRHCLEDYNSPMHFYILQDSIPFIQTTWDSLYIVYDILKTIDFQELGMDSLIQTDYTVFYP